MENQLNVVFQSLPFEEEACDEEMLAGYLQVAQMYAEVENDIAVLSDLKNKKSYIYYGGVAQWLGVAAKGTMLAVDTIWEKELLALVHPDDLPQKFLDELAFLRFLRKKPKKQQADYYLKSSIRMKNGSGGYTYLLHRIMYPYHQASGAFRFALCLYGVHPSSMLENSVVNSVTGESVSIRNLDNRVLSERELAVLSLIGKGLQSKEIAENLSISVHTVSRHRQNILRKLKVSNSIEAYRLVEKMGLF